MSSQSPSSLSLFLSECVYNGHGPGAQQVLFLFRVNKDSVAVESGIQLPPKCEVQVEDLSQGRELARQKTRALVLKAKQ